MVYCSLHRFPKHNPIYFQDHAHSWEVTTEIPTNLTTEGLPCPVDATEAVQLYLECVSVVEELPEEERHGEEYCELVWHTSVPLFTNMY